MDVLVSVVSISQEAVPEPSDRDQYRSAELQFKNDVEADLELAARVMQATLCRKAQFQIQK